MENFYIRVPADETPVDFVSVVEKVDNYLSSENIFDIPTKIMEYSKNKFNYEVTLEPVKSILTISKKINKSTTYQFI